MKKTEDYSPNYSEDLIYFQKWEPDSGVKNGCMILTGWTGSESLHWLDPIRKLPGLILANFIPTLFIQKLPIFFRALAILTSL